MTTRTPRHRAGPAQHDQAEQVPTEHSRPIRSPPADTRAKPPDHFAPFKLNTRTWAALYQQRPAPEDGDYFKADWLRPVETLPDHYSLRIYGGSDYAVTAGGGDYTVHAVVGLDAEGRMYLLDLWRRRAAADE